MCTGIRIVCEDGTVIYARTMEFPTNLASEIMIIPRSIEYISDTGTPAEGLKWTSKYSVLGYNSGEFAPKDIFDGFNEAGLYGGLFAMEPAYIQYAEVTADNADRVVSPSHFLTWILTSFASVEELREHVHEVVVGAVPVGSWGRPAEVHWFVGDKDDAVVLECINGCIKVFDCPLGVITNSPNYDWHMINLRNYAHLTPKFIAPVKLAHGRVTVPTGKSTGFQGLPGDSTTTSRFIKAVAYTQTLKAPKNADDGLLAAVHVLNNFDIVDGSVEGDPNGIEGPSVGMQLTQFTSYSNITDRRFIFKTKDNQSLKGVKWTEELASKPELSFFPLLTKTNPIDFLN